MNANELADELREVSKHSEPHTKIVLGIAESLLRQQQSEIEALKDIVERLIGDWGDGFKNYLYQADSYEENKLRDDVFAILRKASEK